MTVPVAPLNLDEIEAQSANRQQLEIQSLDVSMNGQLTIEFTNKILSPTITTSDAEKDPDSTDP